ncbi:MAG: amidohydrolase [Desulfotignum sp.]|nr:amidohydrolase [Desulfotignum sp.]
MKIKQHIEQLTPEITTLRRDLHQHPELGFQEFRTREQVKHFLAKIGIATTDMAKTGVVGLLEGDRPGRTILLRADMDALPVTEDTNLPWQSLNKGVMHACGHDGHTAMLLGAAKVLSNLKERIRGRIKFVFQPNEEDAGAWLMVEKGVMENPPVDAAFGCHLWSQIDTGTIDIRPGPVMAASHYFSLTIKGKGGHAGFAHESIDPIFVSSAVIQSVQAIQSREINALDPVVVMFTSAHAGSGSHTIVSDEMTLKGSLRVLYKDGEKDIRDRFERIVKNTCHAHRADFHLAFKVGNHLLSNDDAMASLVKKAASEVLGNRNCVTGKVQTMAGEDFSDFAARVPAAFAFIGIRNTAKGIVFPHHHPKFDIDEAMLPKGTELYVRTALAYLAET